LLRDGGAEDRGRWCCSIFAGGEGFRPSVLRFSFRKRQNQPAADGKGGGRGRRWVAEPDVRNATIDGLEARWAAVWDCRCKEAVVAGGQRGEEAGVTVKSRPRRSLHRESTRSLSPFLPLFCAESNPTLSAAMNLALLHHRRRGGTTLCLSH